MASGACTAPGSRSLTEAQRKWEGSSGGEGRRHAAALALGQYWPLCHLGCWPDALSMSSPPTPSTLTVIINDGSPESATSPVQHLPVLHPQSNQGLTRKSESWCLFSRGKNCMKTIREPKMTWGHSAAGLFCTSWMDSPFSNYFDTLLCLSVSWGLKCQGHSESWTPGTKADELQLPLFQPPHLKNSKGARRTRDHV